MSSEYLLLGQAAGLPGEELMPALTHSSWVEDRAESNERLEFLGDSVLGLAIASYLYAQFPDREEGDLAKLKAFVVSRRSCAQVARRIGLDEFVRVHAPAGDVQREDVARSDTALGNMLEAVIGAIYLGKGFDAVYRAVEEAFAAQVTYGIRHYVDYKTTLQEYLAEFEQAPEYRLVAEKGPPHDRTFVSEVVVGGEVWGRGSGRSIKQSEQQAAHRALDSLGVVGEETQR